MAPARMGEGAGTVAGPGLTASRSPHDFLEVMRLKRGAHDKAIEVSDPDLVSSFCLLSCAR